MAERRRGAALEEALLDAAWEELADNGYARFTMDAVVKRAGTSPTVLYRRWSDRDALVRATIPHVLRKHIHDVPDTGSLREDVLTLMREISATRLQLVTVMSVNLVATTRRPEPAPATWSTPPRQGARKPSTSSSTAPPNAARSNRNSSPNASSHSPSTCCATSSSRPSPPCPTTSSKRSSTRSSSPGALTAAAPCLRNGSARSGPGCGTRPAGPASVIARLPLPGVMETEGVKPEVRALGHRDSGLRSPRARGG